jgi:hypothetical protein
MRDGGNDRSNRRSRGTRLYLTRGRVKFATAALLRGGAPRRQRDRRRLIGSGEGSPRRVRRITVVRLPAAKRTEGVSGGA